MFLIFKLLVLTADEALTYGPVIIPMAIIVSFMLALYYIFAYYRYAQQYDAYSKMEGSMQNAIYLLRTSSSALQPTNSHRSVKSA